MMQYIVRAPLLSFIICLLLSSAFPLSVAHSEVVYNAPPAKKITKKKKKQKHFKSRAAFIQQQQKKPDNIVIGLYITFAVLILLPVLVLAGTLIVALGFPGLLAYILGCSLIGVGNIGIILGGVLTGATATYNTQVLYFAVWILFGLNLAAVLTFLLLQILVFSVSPLLLFLTIAVAIAALVFLIWAALITRKKRQFKRASRLQQAQ